MTKKDKMVLIDGLMKLSANLAEIAARLEDAKATEKAPSAAPKPEPALEKAPEPEKQYTYEEVRAVLAEKARNGFRDEVKALLAAYGMKRLSDAIDQPEVYTAMMMEAEGIQHTIILIRPHGNAR